MCVCSNEYAKFDSYFAVSISILVMYTFIIIFLWFFLQIFMCALDCWHVEYNVHDINLISALATRSLKPSVATIMKISSSFYSQMIFFFLVASSQYNTFFLLPLISLLLMFFFRIYFIRFMLKKYVDHECFTVIMILIIKLDTFYLK